MIEDRLMESIPFFKYGEWVKYKGIDFKIEAVNIRISRNEGVVVSYDINNHDKYCQEEYRILEQDLIKEQIR